MSGFRVSAIFGGLVLVLAIVSAALKQARPCGGLSPTYPTMIAFELARTDDDLHAIFGGGASECRDSVAAMLHRANVGDSVIFMECYGIFLCAFFIGMRRLGGAPGLCSAGAALSVLAVLADGVENYYLFRILASLDAARPFLSGLMVATGCKWVSLGVVGLLVALVLPRATRLRVIAAGAAAQALPVSLATMLWPRVLGPFLSISVALSWVVVLIVAASRARTNGPRA